DAWYMVLDGLTKSILERTLGQFHADDEKVVSVPDAEGCQEVGVTDILHELKGLRLDGSTTLLKAQKLHGNWDASRSDSPPHLPETTASESLSQAIPRHKFGSRFQCHQRGFLPGFRHGASIGYMREGRRNLVGCHEYSRNLR